MRERIRFKKLIEVKENLLSEKKKELQRAVDSFEMVSLEIATLEEDIRKNYAKLSLDTMDSNDMYVLREHTIWLEKKKSMLLNEKNRLEERIDHIRGELREILKDIKILETLKTKMLYNLKKITQKKEQKKIDELALRLNLK